MKKSLLLVSALGASLLTGGYLLGQASSTSPGASITAAAGKPLRPVRVATLRTVEQNQTFQSNVQIMQAKRQQFIEAHAAMEKETNAAKKKELKTKVDELLARLNEDNQKMLKAYGFTLERNYLLTIEVAHIETLMTEEEAARFEKAAATAPAKK